MWNCYLFNYIYQPHEYTSILITFSISNCNVFEMDFSNQIFVFAIIFSDTAVFVLAFKYLTPTLIHTYTYKYIYRRFPLNTTYSCLASLARLYTLFPQVSTHRLQPCSHGDSQRGVCMLREGVNKYDVSCRG